ncbi:hypothetical protein A5651_09075 [Mycobacterium sp. 1274761.0]|nr:hypothetical protein A5651_09075 [Mycobacterium sp. 1274761.0]
MWSFDGLQRTYLAIRLVGRTDRGLAGDVPCGWLSATLAAGLARPRLSQCAVFGRRCFLLPANARTLVVTVSWVGGRVPKFPPRATFTGFALVGRLALGRWLGLYAFSTDSEAGETVVCIRNASSSTRFSTSTASNVIKQFLVGLCFALRKYDFRRRLQACPVQRIADSGKLDRLAFGGKCYAE